MSFGTKLKMLRVIHKLDQESMSKKLSLSQSAYSRLENDEKEIKEDDPIVGRVAEEFNVTKQWLLSSDNVNITFESGSIATGAQGIVGNTGPYSNYYSVPKDFLDAFVRQQEMLEKIFEELRKK